MLGSMDDSDRTGFDESRWGVPLRYACDRRRLGPELAERFIPSHLDTEGEAFLASALKRGPGAWRLRAHRLLTLFVSDFDANALLGMYPVFLLSTPQALVLLKAAQHGNLSETRWLDVGAGSGDVTTRVTPLAHSVDCTETSRFMARRLRQRGFNCWRGRVGEGAAGDPLANANAYGVISLFNVLDRTSRPRALLRAAVAHLPVGGALVLSVPLPYEPFFYVGSATREPEERLEIDAEHWEEALGQLWRHELLPLGLSLGAVTRVPYLSGGDAKSPTYVFDSAVLICKKL
jgi:SAM-dependent methyltransferase